MRALLSAVDAGRTVLAPTAEIAAGIIDRIEAHYAASGRAVWFTPQIRDFSGWVRELHQRQNFDRAGALRLLSDIEERELWRQVIARSEIAADFSDPGGAARSARRAAQALREYLIPAPALAAFQSAEANALTGWLADFEARCLALHALSGERLLESLQPPPDAPLWIDNPAWHPQARRWLVEQAGEPLTPRSADDGGVAPARVSVQVHRSFASEIAACAAWAVDCMRRVPAFRAWICIPDLATRRAEVAAAFDAAMAARRYGLQEYLDAPPYALAGGVPLAGLEPVRIALEALTAACDSLSFTRFSALLRSSALQGGVADGVAAARLDELLRSRAPHESPLPLWLDLCERLAAAKSLGSVTAILRLRALDHALNGAPRRLRLSEWVPIWIAALDRGPWAGRANWSSAAYQAAERFRELQGALACADDVYGALSKSAAVHALATAAGETTFQPQTGLAPIWVTAQVSDPWIGFDGIWVTGMAADQWPPAAAPLPLIPVQLQREYGVAGSTAALQLQRSLDLQQRWLARSHDAVFSCASDAGLPAIPSALLAPLQSAAARVAAAEALADPLLHRLRALAPSLEEFDDSVGPAFADDETTRGTVSLKEQSQCPFRGFATTRLRSDRLQLPAPGFSDMERGVLLHKALEIVWRELGGSARLAAMPPPELIALIDASVGQAIRDAVAKRDPGTVWSRREARRLKRLLPLWLAVESGREAFEIAELEAARPGVSFGGLAFNVRIDRIDRLRDGSVVLLDYKSGTVRSDWEGERPDNPQLPIYALSVAEPVAAVAYAQVQARACRFAGVSERDEVLPRVRARKGDAAQGMDAALSVWAGRIETIAAELRHGLARVAPTPAACRSCHLQGFCRISALSAQALDAEGENAGGEA